MARNSVQFQKGLSEANFASLYSTEERCRAVVFASRWPDGFRLSGMRRQGTLRGHHP